MRSRANDIVTPEVLARIEEWAVKGLTNKQIAKNLKIALSTLYRYMDNYPELEEALKRGHEVADDEVENALFRRATGCKVSEDKYAVVEMDQEEYDEHVALLLDAWKQENPDWTAAQRDKYVESIPREKRILVESKVKDVAPDTIAAIFWLKNRRPAQWRDRKNIEMSGELNGNTMVDLSKVSTEDLKKYAAKLESNDKEGGKDGT